MIHQRARMGVVGLAAGLVATAMVSGAVHPGTAAAVPAGAQAPPERPTTITLVTGDVVALGGPRGVDVTSARGREHIGFRTHTDVRGDVHVVPDDALALVSSGRVDPRLFDVSELARNGYGDAERTDLPLIVDYPGTATPRAAGARTVRELPSMSATVLRAEKDARFWAGARTSATKIWLDGPVAASLEHSVPQVGAPRAWEAGLTGTGTTVAVLDTGVDVTHPDLSDAVVGARDFTGSETGTDDRFGHGTHVASIVTGAGDRYRGVAPDAKLLNGKVLDDYGYGYESGIIAGMEWAATSGADVINLSLGGGPTDGTDPMSLAVNRLTADTGALFVIAAGNKDQTGELVTTPGTADAALTVGAVDRNDQLADFSRHGPRWRDGAIKPDITAPGVGIVAAKAANGFIGQPVEDGYVALDGTSMATPHVAGAAAILAGQRPDWTADRLKSTLMASAAPNPGLSLFEQGAGRVDVAAAVTSTVSASPASLFAGVAAWPHDDDQPVAKTLTYTNSGADPITLDLATDLRGPDGDPAPPGMFTLSASEVTVPAGGSAGVTLTTDTRVGTENGSYGGTVVATSGEVTVRTPVAVNREGEVYDVKLTFLDHDGEPTPQYGYRLVDRGTPTEYAHYDESGSVVLRLPKGEYFLEAQVLTDFGEFNRHRTDFAEPKIVVDGPKEYVLDARDGVPPRFVVDDPDAEVGNAFVTYTVDTAWGRTGGHYIVSKYNGYFTRPSRTSDPGAFEFGFEATMAEPDDTGEGIGFHASPYLYNLRKTTDGVVPAELVYRVTNGELAKVRSTHAVATPGMIGVRDGTVSMPLPYTLTEYYTPDTDWFPDFYETNEGEWVTIETYARTVEPVSYRPGTTTRERWNVGVFGPGLPLITPRPGDVADHLGEEQFARLGDTLQVLVPMHSDQNLGRDNGIFFTDGTTELLRDGEVIAENGYAGHVYTELPPERGTYTLRTTVAQDGPLSTEIDTEWTFASGHAEGATPTRIPALVVRFAPNLDDHNAAPAGRKFRFPVHVQRNGAESPGEVTRPTVEVSYDDGTTWREARLTRSGGGWIAETNHPRDAEFVSLRGSVSDPNGNVTKQTIIHAYALKK